MCFKHITEQLSFPSLGTTLVYNTINQKHAEHKALFKTKQKQKNIFQTALPGSHQSSAKSPKCCQRPSFWGVTFALGFSMTSYSLFFLSLFHCQKHTIHMKQKKVWKIFFSFIMSTSKLRFFFFFFFFFFATFIYYTFYSVE